MRGGEQVSPSLAPGIDDGVVGVVDPVRLRDRWISGPFPPPLPHEMPIELAFFKHGCLPPTTTPRSVKKLERPEAQRPSGVSIAVPEMVQYDFAGGP